MAALVPTGLASAAPAASSLLEPAGGVLWSRTDSSGGFSQSMTETETIVSSDRSAWSLSDEIALDKSIPLAAFFTGFALRYEESTLRGELESAEFRMETTAAGNPVGLRNYFDIVFPWGTGRFTAEYPQAGAGQAASAIVLRYDLFKLKYALSGLDDLAANTAIDVLDRMRFTIKLYSDRGNFSFDVPAPFFIELRARLKARF